MIRVVDGELIQPNCCHFLGGLFGGGGSSSSATTAVNVEVNPNITNLIDIGPVEKLVRHVAESTQQFAAVSYLGQQQAAQASLQAGQATVAQTVTLERLAQIAAVIATALMFLQLRKGK